jgi:hypothetical protein
MHWSHTLLMNSIPLPSVLQSRSRIILVETEPKRDADPALCSTWVVFKQLTQTK